MSIPSLQYCTTVKQDVTTGGGGEVGNCVIGNFLDFV